MSGLRPSDRAPGLLVAADAVIAEDVGLGAHVVIHAGVVIEDGCRIQDGAVIGKQVVLGPNSRAPAPPAAAPTRLERGAAVGCHAVIVAGAHVAPGAVVGDHALVREGARLEAGAVLGFSGVISRDCRVGARTRLMAGAALAPGTVIEADVFCGPHLSVTNDAAMGRERAASHPVTTLRRACRVAANVTLLPGVEIGEEAIVGAGAVVTRDVAPRTVVLGAPARVVREVAEGELLRDDPVAG